MTYQLPNNRVGVIKLSGRPLVHAALPAALRSFRDLSPADQRNAVIVADEAITLPDGSEKRNLLRKDVAAIEAALASRGR
jgi:hypothetical protein